MKKLAFVFLFFGCLFCSSVAFAEGQRRIVGGTEVLDITQTPWMVALCAKSECGEVDYYNDQF